jgi:hypothetical protein
MGAAPDWYKDWVAAKQLGITPWELETAPQVWIERALVAGAAENEAEKLRAKQPW